MSTGYVSSPVPTSSAPAFLLFSLNWIILRSQPMGVMQLQRGRPAGRRATARETDVAARAGNNSGVRH